MQSSKEQQGEIRKPSSVINARNRGKQQDEKDQRSLQENQRYEGNFSCKDGHNKGQKWYGPNRSRRYQEEVARIHRRTIKKRSFFMTQITMMVLSLTQSQTSWNTKSSGPQEASLQTKLVEVMEFQLSFQILKDDAVKVLHSICQQIWKTQQWPQDWKMSVFIPIPKKGNAKECSNYCTVALISHASKVMLKILQARLQQYVIRELPDVQAGFR